MGSVKLLGKPKKLGGGAGSDLRWTSIPSRGSRNTPTPFMLQQPGITSGSYEPLGSKASFPKCGATKTSKPFCNIIKSLTFLLLRNFHAGEGHGKAE